MSDVLSPAEQARAAQFVARWLADNGYGSTSITGKDVIWALTVNTAQPESVESLRAERDAAKEKLTEVRAERDALWQEKMERQSDVARITAECEEWKEAAQAERGFANAARKALNAARDDLEKAEEYGRNTREQRDRTMELLGDSQAKLTSLRSTQTEAEAAWGRCQRED